MASMARRKILCVGLVCVDIIQVCDEYPIEDSDQRSIDSRFQRGGNASNNCTALASCRQECEFFGTMTDDSLGKYVKQDFEKLNISTENVVVYPNHNCPFSSVIINSKSGSRTIIHSNKDMPELTCADFRKLDLNKYCWIHFEGRNVKEVSMMLEHVENWNSSNNPPIRTSVELEKPREELAALLPLADYVFLGKDFALMQGCSNKFNALKQNIGSLKPGSAAIVAWGETGAIACYTVGDPVESPAFPLSNVVDTLGAGDTFIATTVACLSRGQSLEASITAACKVAGSKISKEGFSAVNYKLLKALKIID